MTLVLDLDRHRTFRFASLQSDAGKRLLERHGIEDDLDIARGRTTFRKLRPKAIASRDKPAPY